jgi:hypothetical protein
MLLDSRRADAAPFILDSSEFAIPIIGIAARIRSGHFIDETCTPSFFLFYIHISLTSFSYVVILDAVDTFPLFPDCS